MTEANKLSKERLQTWGFVDAIDPSANSVLDKLERTMKSFYEEDAVKQGYWHLPEAANAVWEKDTHYFHNDLASRIVQGESVADFGCGSAEAYLNLYDKKINYVGLDLSAQVIAGNRLKFPDALFSTIEPKSEWKELGFNCVDWAISLFALEHVVRPLNFLKLMAASLKENGRLCIICPDFQFSMNSIRMGGSALVKKDKLRRGHIWDLLIHLIEEKWIWPNRVAAIHKSEMRFPIYTRPNCLEAPYYSDNDAVHLVTERKLCAELEALGLVIESRADDLIKASKRGPITYVIARADKKKI